jgi:hypothetical protein
MTSNDITYRVAGAHLEDLRRETIERRRAHEAGSAPSISSAGGRRQRRLQFRVRRVGYALRVLV